MPKFTLVNGGVATHRFTTKKGVKEVKVPIKRMIRNDRSRYSGADLRAIYRKNGSGKGLLLLADRDAKKTIRAIVAQACIAAE